MAEDKPRSINYINRILSKESIGRYTNFHDNKMAFLEPPFDLTATFTEKVLEQSRIWMAGKVCMITIASAGFGLGMGMLMGSFEYNMTMGVDNSRGGWSQVR